MNNNENQNNKKDNNTNKNEKPLNNNLEGLKRRTNKYPVYNVFIAPDRIKKVPDLLNGGLRKRRYGLILGMGAIPDFSKMDETPMVETRRVPQILIDADTIQDLKDAAIREITKICDIMQKFVDGEILTEEEVSEFENQIENNDDDDDDNDNNEKIQ
jgi:hypothetical protein